MRRFLWILPLLILLAACKKQLPVETTAFIPATNPPTTSVTTEAPSQEKEFARLVLDILAAQGVAKDFSDVTELYLDAVNGPHLYFTLASGRAINLTVAATPNQLQALVKTLDLLAILPLTNIYIEVAGIGDNGMSVFAAFPTLQKLTLRRSDASLDQNIDLTPLAACENIEDLILVNLPTEDVSPLALLRHLSTAMLVSCGLTEFPAALASLPCLEVLELSENQIEAIPLLGWQHFPNLRYLNLSYNKLNDIQGILTLQAPAEVYLAHNQITDISVFAELSLRYAAIDLSSNQITDVSPLAGCFNAVQINLTNNQIADGTPITGLFSEVLRTRDAYYDLSHNPLEEIGPVPVLNPTDRRYAFTYNGREIFSALLTFRDTPFQNQSISVSFPD